MKRNQTKFGLWKLDKPNFKSKTEENYEKYLPNSSSNQKAKTRDFKKKEKWVSHEVLFKSQMGKF